MNDWTSPLNDANGKPLPRTSLADIPREQVTRGYNSLREHRREQRKAVKDIPHVNVEVVRHQMRMEE